MTASKYFTRDNLRQVWTLTDDAPEGLQEAVQAAHGGMRPSDWIYEACQSAAGALDDGALDHDTVDAWADGEVEIGTYQVITWYAEHRAHLAINDGDLSGTIEEQCQQAQSQVLSYIAHTMLAWREELPEDDEE